MSFFFTFAQAVVASCIAVGVGSLGKWFIRIIWPVTILNNDPTCSVCNRGIIWPMGEPVPVWIRCIECKAALWKKIAGLSVAFAVVSLIACAFYEFLW